MDGLNSEEQFAVLRDLTNRLHVLHEAQIIQLKYWFFMLYSEVSKFEITFDPDSSTLTYKVLSVKNAEEFANNKNLGTLNEYVQFLLGKRFVTKVINGEEGR